MKVRLWLLLSLLASGITWVYMSRVLLPWEYYIDVERGRLKAQMGDLYPRWVGTRELLLRGRNPYGPDVSHQIQMAFYGRVIDQGYEEPGVDPIDEQRFAYPVYIVFFLAPTIYLDFSRLQIWAPVVFTMLTLISVLFWLDVLRWRPPRIIIGSILLFVLSCPQIVQGLRLRQLGLMVAFLLVLSSWLVFRGHLAVAGIVLAISTVKPQMAVLPVVWFLLWSAGALRRRWPLVAGFGLTLAALAGLGQLVLPGWLRYFVDGVVAYRKYFPKPSLLGLALGNWVGGVVSAIAIVGLVALAWGNRKADADSPEFIRTLAAFFIVAIFVVPSLLTPFNQVLLLLPILMIIRDWALVPRIGRRLFAAILAWPWLCSFVLLWLRPHVDSPNRLPLLPSVTVLFLPFLLLLLFVMRWGQANTSQLSANLPR